MSVVCPLAASAFLVVASVFPATAAVLLDVRGTGAKSTQKFAAVGDWELEYTFDCKSIHDPVFGVLIKTGTGGLTSLLGPSGTGNSGHDTDYYHSNGSFYLEAFSNCVWHITVRG